MRAGIVVLVITALIGIGLASPEAHADGLDFTSGSSGGTISYNGSLTGMLTGAAIPITQVAFTGMGPQSVSGLTCGAASCGQLAFTTGTFISAVGNTYTFSGGGSLTITGMVAGGSMTTLIQATFEDNVTVSLVSGSGGVGSIWQITGPILVNSLDSSLVSLFPGLTLANVDGAVASQIQLKVSSISGGAFSGIGASPDVFVPAQIVPEPSSMLLLGSGLLGLGMLLKSRSPQA